MTDVDAIEEGKIVRVSEEYAKREGLLIIRKKIEEPPEMTSAKLQAQTKRAERRAKPLLEEFRRPLDYRNNNVIQDLKENFQWEITKKRREKNISRHTLAKMVGVSEDDIISLEHGILPKDNFLLVSKVENCLGINLRRSREESLANSKNSTLSTQKVVSSLLSEEEIDLSK